LLILCGVVLLGPLLNLFFREWRTAACDELFASDSPDRPRLIGLGFATLRLTAGTTALACVLGVTVALAIQRARGRWRRLLASLYPIPLLLPPAIVAVGWTHLLGKRGLAAALWRQWTGAPELPFSIYGEWGSACVLALCWFPLVTLATLVGLRMVGTRMGAAGRIYAGFWQRTWKLDLPLLLPYVSAGGACVAWLALGDFDVPSVFLRNAYPIEIFTAFQAQPNVARAVAVSLPLVLGAALVLALRQALARRGSVATLDTGWSATTPEQEWPVSTSRMLQAAAVVVLMLAVAAPLVALAHQTEDWNNVRLALWTAGQELLTTFRIALLAGLVAVLAAAPYARLLNTCSGRWQRGVLALLAIVPLAIPGTLHGLAWLQTLAAYAWGRELLQSPLLVPCATRRASSRSRSFCWSPSAGVYIRSSARPHVARVRRPGARGGASASRSFIRASWPPSRWSSRSAQANSPPRYCSTPLA